MASPGDKPKPISLAKLTTESSRMAGAGGKAILLAITVVPTVKEYPGSSRRKLLLEASVDPASKIFPLPSGIAPRAEKDLLSPRYVEKRNWDKLGSNPATKPERGAKDPWKGARVGKTFESVTPLTIMLPDDESTATLCPLSYASPPSRVAARI